MTKKPDLLDKRLLVLHFTSISSKNMYPYILKGIQIVSTVPETQNSQYYCCTLPCVQFHRTRVHTVDTLYFNATSDIFGLTVSIHKKHYSQIIFYYHTRHCIDLSDSTTTSCRQPTNTSNILSTQSLKLVRHTCWS